MKHMTAALFAIAAVLPVSGVDAQTYPGKPLRFITESAAGSIIDVAMRRVLPELSAQLGQPAILENRTGSSGIMATETCIRAAPDGYTACTVSANTVSFNPNVFLKLSYDPERDLKPVTRLFFLNSALTVSAALPVQTMEQLRDYVVARPGKLNFGTLGPGSQTDVFRQFLVDQWKTDIVGVPYKSGNLVVNALVAGEIEMGMLAISSVVPQLQSGKARVIALGAEQRSKQLPGVPLLRDFSLDEGNSRVFWGIMFNSGVSDAIVARLNAELVHILQDAKVVEFLESRFLEPAPSTPQEFAAFLRADRAQVARLVTKYNVPRQ
jgi:tripartite-type tricarboxylate transporter receptor subunit TctC